ncbi:HPr kinase/phosphatase C-terminal domain-containing protein [Roseobacter sp. N2S]|uniref:HPr kinase/phosphorylase n=1 Tax=Roseobacter sp. N2S TaxID=2663844 RepID=UPI0028674305|nr:HPr kinase/phosphatase C-terminal domain-containing protein [Roseobacter sp. N2S]MDR6265995.1 HPr kinase/phosphorylase [Roseobacter sp. N2S]
MTADINQSPVHGTAVAVGGRGFLFLGPSGAGKSGLALQMIALGAKLVADDQVCLTRRDAAILLTSPPALSGLVEARSVGLLTVPTLPQAELQCVVDLATDPETRMPHPQHVHVQGCRIDLINGRNVPNLAFVLMILGQNAQPSPG